MGNVIYCWTCISTGKKNVGKATGEYNPKRKTGVEARRAQYHYYAKLPPEKQPKQPKLMASFNKYGIENHRFEILEFLDPTEIQKNPYLPFERELWHVMDQGDTVANGLNCRYPEAKPTKRGTTNSPTWYEKKERSYTVIDPKGNKVEFKGLTKFCKANNLNQAGLWCVINNRYAHHKGWRAYHPALEGVPFYQWRDVYSEQDIIHMYLEEKLNVRDIRDIVGTGSCNPILKILHDNGVKMRRKVRPKSQNQ